jgi:hypothetical protein
MTATVHLYELAEARDILDTFLGETEGEVTPELQQLLDELAGKTEEKIERVALYVREQLATAAAIDEEAKRLSARAATKKRAAEGLKAYLKMQLTRLGVKKVDGLLCTVAVQNNPPAVTHTLEGNELWALLGPDQAFVQRRETVAYVIDREAILAAWKNNEPLPAALRVDVGQHVRIR